MGEDQVKARRVRRHVAVGRGVDDLGGARCGNGWHLEGRVDQLGLRGLWPVTGF